MRSGNECAYPNCDHPIFNDQGLYIAELCHIKAGNTGGQRFDEDQKDEERNSHNNLVFLCHRHHKETDSLSVDELTKMKTDHESKFTESGKEFSKEMIKQVISESNYYWSLQSNKSFDLPELKIKRDFETGIFELFEELEFHIKRIQDYCDMCAKTDSTEFMTSDLKKLFEKLQLDFSRVENVPYYENPFVSRNWEVHNIGNPNFFAHLSLCLNQLKVKTAEELLRLNPKDKKLKVLVVELRKNFESDYDNSYYTD